LWYSGGTRARNGVGILVEKELIDRVVEVRHKNDRVMSIKLVQRAEVLNVIYVYAPQMGLIDDIKRVFWEELEAILQGIPQRNCSWGEILMARLEIGLMGMLGPMEVLGLGKEIVEGWHFWTLL